MCERVPRRYEGLSEHDHVLGCALHAHGSLQCCTVAVWLQHPSCAVTSVNQASLTNQAFLAAHRPPTAGLHFQVQLAHSTTANLHNPHQMSHHK